MDHRSRKSANGWPGRDGKSHPPLGAPDSADDVIRANDGAYIGLAANY